LRTIRRAPYLLSIGFTPWSEAATKLPPSGDSNHAEAVSLDAGVAYPNRETDHKE
jgi:hypothetical protein